MLNKGTAFSQEEREQFGLEGFLPIAVESEENQIARIKQHLSHIDNDLHKYIYLAQDLRKTPVIGQKIK